MRDVVNTGLGFRDEIRPISATEERVLGLRTNVSPDGDAAVFTVQFTNMPAFNVHIGIEEIFGIQHEVRTAAQLMGTRQRLKLDHGHQKLLEMCQTSLRPAWVEVLIDPITMDRLFILQFRDHSPVVIRQSPTEVAGALQQLAIAVARAGN